MDLYSRLIRGKITAVNPEKCTCTVQLSDITSQVNCLMGFPFVSGNSGIRFLPKGGEDVLVSFSPQGVPRIVSFLLDQNLIQTYKDNPDSVYYRELKPGDVAIYSGKSETEIFLSSSGRIEIGSGVSVIQLDSLRRAIEFITGMIRLSTLSGVTLNAGYLVRNIAGVEQRFPGLVEYNVGIEKETGKIASLKMGDVLSDLGIPKIGQRLIPKVFSLKSYLGIVPLGDIYLDAAGGSFVTGNRDVTLDGPIIYIGGLLATFSVVRGEVLVSILTQLVGALATGLSALQPKSGEDAVVAGAISTITGLLGQLPGMLSLTVRVR